MHVGAGDTTTAVTLAHEHTLTRRGQMGNIQFYYNVCNLSALLNRGCLISFELQIVTKETLQRRPFFLKTFYIITQNFSDSSSVLKICIRKYDFKADKRGHRKRKINLQ